MGQRNCGSGRMTEPAQKDIFTKRWRRVRTLDPRESQIQIQLIAELKIRARPGVMYFHVPNGEERNKILGAKLKAMGTLAGVADLIFIWYTDRIRVLFLELKRRGKPLSPEQYAFCEKIRKAGAIYDIADSVAAAIDILQRHDLLRR
jgi:hypothetical protein